LFVNHVDKKDIKEEVSSVADIIKKYKREIYSSRKSLLKII